MDFRRFDSSIILILRGGIPKPIGDFPENLSPAILAGIMLVGRSGLSYSGTLGMWATPLDGEAGRGDAVSTWQAIARLITIITSIIMIIIIMIMLIIVTIIMITILIST